MGEILIETVRPAGIEGDLSGPPVPEAFSKRAPELATSLGDIATTLREGLEAQLETEPKEGLGLRELRLTFGVELQAEAGMFIAKAGTTASFEAALTFRTT